MRQAIFLETGTNPFSWPYPAHVSDDLCVEQWEHWRVRMTMKAAEGVVPA